MTEKFTPGEWVQKFYSDGIEVVSKANGYEVICYFDYEVCSEKCHDNAALISAAPEMYALLSIILSPTAMMSQQFRDEGLRTAIENVLKKARGEE